MNRQSIRFRWSHHHPIHRYSVRLANTGLRHVPFPVKYGLGKRMRASSYPYRLIKPGWVTVQVGAPKDTLLAGRSRGMYFSLLAGDMGKVVIVEPDAESVKIFKRLARQREITNLVFSQTAAWFEQTLLRVYLSDVHPASSFTEGTKKYDAKHLEQYREIEIPSDTLDNIVAKHGIATVDLVSITTNGAEMEILGGMKRLIANGLPFICLARTGDNYLDAMSNLGYQLYGHDDRGFTFKRIF